VSIKLCPICNQFGKMKVIDTRIMCEGAACRRRYSCVCGARFSTAEVICDDIKRGGNRGSHKVLGRIAGERIVKDSYDEIG
jgi:transcriptional regulator NrdR family protein